MEAGGNGLREPGPRLLSVMSLVEDDRWSRGPRAGMSAEQDALAPERLQQLQVVVGEDVPAREVRRHQACALGEGADEAGVLDADRQAHHAVAATGRPLLSQVGEDREHGVERQLLVLPQLGVVQDIPHGDVCPHAIEGQVTHEAVQASGGAGEPAGREETHVSLLPLIRSLVPSCDIRLIYNTI